MPASLWSVGIKTGTNLRFWYLPFSDFPVTDKVALLVPETVASITYVLESIYSRYDATRRIYWQAANGVDRLIKVNTTTRAILLDVVIKGPVVNPGADITIDPNDGSLLITENDAATPRLRRLSPSTLAPTDSSPVLAGASVKAVGVFGSDVYAQSQPLFSLTQKFAKLPLNLASITYQTDIAYPAGSTSVGVPSIEQDNQGRIWVANTKCLARIDPATGVATIYDLSVDLQVSSPFQIISNFTYDPLSDLILLRTSASAFTPFLLRFSVATGLVTGTTPAIGVVGGGNNSNAAFRRGPVAGKQWLQYQSPLSIERFVECDISTLAYLQDLSGETYWSVSFLKGLVFVEPPPAIVGDLNVSAVHPSLGVDYRIVG